MPYYRQVGEIPPKRHTQFRRPDGGLYAEELMGEEGFSAESALLYHRHPPTAIMAAEALAVPAPTFAGDARLLPHHLRTRSLDAGGDAVFGRTLLLANDDVAITTVAATTDSPLYRNATADELIYVESGQAILQSVFGELVTGPGDYVVIPRSTTHRWIVIEGPWRALVLEVTGHVTTPNRYLSHRGQFLEHAPYCERDLRSPGAPLVVDDDGPALVVVRHRLGWTRFTYAHHPFDVVGWDGCLYPYALAVSEFEPITGRIHQPPPVHQTFEAPHVVVCTFVPRKLDYHPLSVPAPYNHANVDSDEVLFYAGGTFTSRKGVGIEIGSITVHPAGFIHGPQPGSAEASIGKESTDELAVMVDTFRPLRLTEAALSCEDAAYPWTWVPVPLVASDDG